MMYRQQLVASLAELSDPKGNQALMDIARDKQGDINVRADVAQALINSKDPAQVTVAIDTLVEVLKAPQSFGVFGAVQALGKAGAPGTDAMVTFLKDPGTDVPRRVSVAESLNRLEMDPATQQKFITLLDDKTIDAGVRSAIARGVIGYQPFGFGSKPEKIEPHALDFLIVTFKNTADGDESRTKIASALAWTHDSKALAALNEVLNGGAEGLKKDATLGLASIHDARALDPMITLLNNSDTKTVWQYNNLVNTYTMDPSVADADKARAKKAVEAAAPKIKAAQEAQMAEAMKQYNASQKPVKPPSPPDKNDF